jgi:rubredoxin
MRGAKIDRQATEEAYKYGRLIDERKRSFVSTKGHLYLAGPDMTQQRMKVYERDKGKCQTCGAAYGWNYGHAHHRIHRGKGGSDDLDNLEWSCPTCHREKHVRPRFGEAARPLAEDTGS